MTTLVMGILNVTPDSFSDGGLYVCPEAAIARGMEMIEEGADIIDIGGESTRPGAALVSADEESARVLPVVTELSRHIRVSIDTRNPRTADSAVTAGATIINDVSASLAEVAAARGVGWIAMHMLGDPGTMQQGPEYDDVVSEVAEFLFQKAEWAAQLGISEVWIDPGIGFGKTTEHNLLLLKHLDRMTSSPWPVVLGASRKSFLGRILGSEQAPAPPDARLEGSIASIIWAVSHNAAVVRVHDVAQTVRAIKVAEAIRDVRTPDPGELKVK